MRMQSDRVCGRVVDGGVDGNDVAPWTNHDVIRRVLGRGRVQHSLKVKTRVVGRQWNPNRSPAVTIGGTPGIVSVGNWPGLVPAGVECRGYRL